MGTAGYASPEQFGFTQTGFGADIYAMGVLLNFMLTGKMPNEKLCSGKYASIVKKATQIKEEDTNMGAAMAPAAAQTPLPAHSP